MKKLFRNILAAGALAAASMSASANLPFTVDTALMGGPLGSGATTFVADGINGDYTESIIFDASANWEAVIIVNFSSYVLNRVNVAPTNTGFAPGAYDHQLYLVLDASGTTSFTAEGPRLVVTDGSFNFWLDADADTSILDLVTLQGSGMANTIDTTGDIDLGGSDEISGGGILTGTGAGFDVTATGFELTAAGSNFFVAPNPFYQIIFSDGSLDSDILDPTLAGVYQYDGRTAGVAFVSSPSAVAMMGLALFGLGFVSRRRNK